MIEKKEDLWNWFVPETVNDKPWWFVKWLTRETKSLLSEVSIQFHEGPKEGFTLTTSHGAKTFYYPVPEQTVEDAIVAVLCA